MAYWRRIARLCALLCQRVNGDPVAKSFVNTLQSPTLLRAVSSQTHPHSKRTIFSRNGCNGSRPSTFKLRTEFRSEENRQTAHERLNATFLGALEVAFDFVCSVWTTGTTRTAWASRASRATWAAASAFTAIAHCVQWTRNPPTSHLCIVGVGNGN